MQDIIAEQATDRIFSIKSCDGFNGQLFDTHVDYISQLSHKKEDKSNPKTTASYAPFHAAKNKLNLNSF